jgi:hypothetical protein
VDDKHQYFVLGPTVSGVPLVERQLLSQAQRGAIYNQAVSSWSSWSEGYAVQYEILQYEIAWLVEPQAAN